MSTAKIPLPKMHTSGAIVAHKHEVGWWPRNEDFERQEPATVRGLAASKDPDQQAALSDWVSLNNRVWKDAAQKHLVEYLAPFERRRHINRTVVDRVGDAGLISEALTRIRDDRVVQGSIDGLDDGTQAGLAADHRDVLAAIALLTRLEHRGDNHILVTPDSLPPTKKI